MDNRFINTIEINNFKCFEQLHVDGVQRVNLISGKNNIGKTSFMEALELSVSSNDSFDLAFNISKIVRRRQRNVREDSRFFELDIAYNNQTVSITTNAKKIEITYFDEFIKKVNNESRVIEYSLPNDLLFEDDNITVMHESALKLTYQNQTRIVPLERVVRPMMRRDSNNIASINFISSNITIEREIAIYYGKLVNLNKEDFLNDSLRIFDENIIALKQIVTERDVVLKLLLKNRVAPVLLSSLGEGINRYIAILCAIWASQDGYLFIDEIENGIHYTNYPKLWKIIFEASNLANCQIFITTHSKECIAAFNKINSENDGAYFEFYRSKKTDQINVKQRDKEQLEYSLSHNGEFRGE